MDKIKVHILMAKTGGGHNAVAVALKQALETKYRNNVEVTITDGISKYAPFPVKYLDKTYPWQIKIDDGETYGKIWTILNNPTRAQLFMRSFTPIAAPAVKKILKQKADVIVSTHPLYVYPIIWAMKKKHNFTPFISYVSDLVVTHALWCNTEVDMMLVPTREAYDQAIKHGMNPRKVIISGLPLRNEFSTIKANKSLIRKNLGLNPHKATVFLMAGGQGMGNLYKIVKAICKYNRDLQLIVVAGSNTKLKSKIENSYWPLDVKVYGFTDKISELMHAADIVVTKAGPTSISEALACKTPVIISGFIPAQEEDNVNYVKKIKAGVLAETPEKIAKTIKKWLSNKNTLAKLSANAAKYADTSSASKAAEIIYNYALANYNHSA